MEMSAKLFFVWVAAVFVGLIVGKYASKGLAHLGLPIAAGNPVPKTLPGQPVLPWRTA